MKLKLSQLRTIIAEEVRGKLVKEARSSEKEAKAFENLLDRGDLSMNDIKAVMNVWDSHVSRHGGRPLNPKVLEKAMAKAAMEKRLPMERPVQGPGHAPPGASTESGMEIPQYPPVAWSDDE